MSLAAIPQAALHMSKVQFYSCLKLIAAHQSEVLLRKELIASSVTLPLPKFSWKESLVEDRSAIAPNGLTVTSDDRKNWQSKANHYSDLFELTRTDVQNDTVNSDVTNTDSEVEPKDDQCKISVRIIYL